ncbi:hypothetical protein LA52FAK_44230 [Desulforhopalus sp. 52FAK]
MKNIIKQLTLFFSRLPIGNNSYQFFGLLLLAIFVGTTSQAYGETCSIPEEAGLEDISSPDIVVGSGTPETCTSAAFVQAVAQGGVITFDCGPDPITIILDETAKVVNNTGPEIVIDGGGLVTLSGGGVRRILYMNTCDSDQVWTTSHCQNQDHPRLTIQNLTFTKGNSTGLTYDGGGAVWVRGGRFKIVNCRFTQNVCDSTGPDVGGAAVRVFSQYNSLPVYVVNSVFGGSEEDGNSCSNGGGISSIGVSWTVINSLFSHNKAIGNGGNPAQSGTLGGGSGAAIYNDGNMMELNICGTAIHDNEANEYGGSIFFVSNDHSGTMTIKDSGLWNNAGGWRVHDGGISCHSDTPVTFIGGYRSSGVIIPQRIAIDVDSDEKIGLAEIIHNLVTISEEQTPETSLYGRKMGDINYDHNLDVTDVIKGLRLLSGDN